jgi:hypothetical protein
MTLGRRHALGLGLLLALLVEPPVLQPFVSAQLQQPEPGVKEAPLRLLSALGREARELKVQSPWAVATAPGGRAGAPD